MKYRLLAKSGLRVSEASLGTMIVCGAGDAFAVRCLTRLNTRPARSPGNASTPPLREAPHDSGPMWVANSHSYDFCIHSTSPVLAGAQGARNEIQITRQ